LWKKYVMLETNFIPNIMMKIESSMEI